MFHVYMDLDTLFALPHDLRHIPARGEFTLDLIDQSISVVVSVSETEVKLTTGFRTLGFLGLPDDLMEQGSITWSRADQSANEEIVRKFNAMTQKECEMDLSIYLGVVAMDVLSAMTAQGVWEQAEAIDEESQGILIVEGEDGTAVMKIVEGRERPNLKYANLSGNAQMYRPYEDEIAEGFFYGMMPMEVREELAEDGDPTMMEQVYLAYLNGEEASGVAQDFEKAAYWAGKWAESGSTNAMFNLGLHYAKGCGVERDFAKAVDWMKKAAEAGDSDAPGAVSRFSKMQDLLLKARQNDAAAQADLAQRLMNMTGTLKQAGAEKDYADAFYWAQRASQNGDPDGHYALALCYEFGRGTGINHAKAAELYRKGATAGHAPSQYNLGCCYTNGGTVVKDERKGFELFRMAAEQGYGLAMRELGKCYQFGRGVGYDMKKAVEWYEKSLMVSYDSELAQKVAIFRTLPEVSGEEDSENFTDAAVERSGFSAYREQEEAGDLPSVVFQGKIFVLTGYIRDFDYVVDQILARGGDIKKSTVLNTDYLIYDEESGTDTVKYRRALELIARGKPITLVPLQKFMAVLNHGSEQNRVFSADKMITEAMDKSGIPHDEHTLEGLSARDVYDILGGTYDPGKDRTALTIDMLRGKNIVLSTLRPEEESYAESAVGFAGGRLQSEIGPDTDFLVYDEALADRGDKYRCALERNERGQNIRLITSDDLCQAVF